ncbi:MAG TPA: hypothetical protein VFE25_07220 [Opitutaceae bacterium]|nr:hypothetical protein [Opitutaceae bacterium]
MPKKPKDSDPKAAYPSESSASMKRFASRSARDHLWAFLDVMDEKPRLKRGLMLGVPILIIALGAGYWGYHRWARTNAVRIARQWLEAGRLDRASAAISDALENEPDLPASWGLASELAWRKGNKAASVDYARRAALVSRYGPDEVVAWAEAAILAGDEDKAREALSYLDPLAAKQLPRALRVSAELARRSGRFTEARDAFEAALKADTEAGSKSVATDEVPLGIVCLQTGLAADRSRGQALVSKWASDPEWGADALRALLADAVAHGDKDGTILWAEGLRKHPKCTFGDIPVCLKALAASDTAKFTVMLQPLEDHARAVPNEAAQVLGWLNEIGQARESVRWGAELDSSMSLKPPVAQGLAEAYRANGQWPELSAWADKAQWGADLEFVGWAYGMAAARHLGDTARADSLWKSLEAEGGRSPAHALFMGDTLVSWGYWDNAATLLWEAADRPDLSFLALGSLARLYQVEGDAVGQYRAFMRLNSMRPTDRNIANNFAYFAALTDLGSLSHVESMAADNFNREPGSTVYRSTYAFVLVWANQGAKAMEVMAPVAQEWRKSRPIAFSYGAALSSVGRKQEAREVFDSLDPKKLSAREREWIAAALR